jgi:DNA topoisomerase-3
VTLARGGRAVVGVGRVKTPTLAIVCRRELEIRGTREETADRAVAHGDHRRGSARCYSCLFWR